MASAENNAGYPQRGDLFISYPAERHAHRHLIQVTRTARDRSWADIRVMTWAVMWTKRQRLPFAFPHETFGGWESPARWFEAQQDDHEAMLHDG